MLRPRHITCGVRSARGGNGRLLALLLVMACTVVPASSASSQTAQPALPDSVRAFLTARQWVDQFDLPAMDDPDAAVTIDDAAAVCVTLRHNGRVVGSGVDVTGDARALRRAVGLALSETLGDETVRNVPQTLRDTIGTRLTLELDVAGPLRPLIARTTEQVQRRFEPGLDGLAMRRADRLAVVFPSQMLRSGAAANLDAAISRLAAAVNLRAAPLSELIDRHGVSIYRFRTVHMVQNAPHESPRATHRGLRIVSMADVTPDSIADFADAAATHLINKLWIGDEPLGVLGDYDALRDQYLPLTASPRDQGLAALALSVYADAARTTEMAERSRNTADAIVRELALVESTEAPPYDDPAACALILASLPPNVEDDQDLDALADHALATLGPIARLEGDDLRTALGAFDPTTRGLVTLALQSPRVDPAAAARVLRACFDVTDEPSFVALMPWAYMAVAASPAPRGEALLGDRDLLEHLRLALFNRQVKQPAAPRVESHKNNDWVDLVGGFQLSPAGTSRPTAQSARPAALLTLMLADEALPDAQRPVAQRVQQLALRYLMQLQVTEADAWALRNPDRALGGVRSATWSSELPTAATAMALLAASLADTPLLHSEPPDANPVTSEVREPGD